MDTLSSMSIEQYRFMPMDHQQSTASTPSSAFSGDFQLQRDNIIGSSSSVRDVSSSIDPSSPFYRSYLRAVCFLAEQCEHFYGDPSCGLEKFIKDIIVGKISPNQDGFVLLSASSAGSGGRPAGVWLDDKPTRLIRELQRHFESGKLNGEHTSKCFSSQLSTSSLSGCGGRPLDQARNQFFVDCYTECLHPVVQGSRLKANTTECVPVPSSEHVAEIVGKKGGKIKNIRAETNTYIKTPKRDEEPVFVITGRKEDVSLAKQKILAAADHFTQLREARRQNAVAGGVGGICSGTGANGGAMPLVGPPKREGDVTVSVEVPYEFVGLVVGLKGATIKRIQQDTNTYITTPSRRHRPIFEVVGQPMEVERAREAIRSHINSRVEKFRAENLALATAGGSGRISRCSPIGGGMFCSSSSFISSGVGSSSAAAGGFGDLSSGCGNVMEGVASSSMLSGLHHDHVNPHQSFSASELSMMNAYNNTENSGAPSMGVSWSTAVGSMGYSGLSNNTINLMNGDTRSPPSLSIHSQQMQPFHHQDTQAGMEAPPAGGRLSAFKRLPMENSSATLGTLSSDLNELSLCGVGETVSPADSGVGLSGGAAGSSSYWNMPGRSAVSGDPADPQLCRRLSDDGISSSSSLSTSSQSSTTAQRDIGTTLFNFSGHLGWSGSAKMTVGDSSTTDYSSTRNDVDDSAASHYLASSSNIAAAAHLLSQQSFSSVHAESTNTALSDSLAASIAAVSVAAGVSQKAAGDDTMSPFNSDHLVQHDNVTVVGDLKSVSSETLNSDSGVELVTPPPSLSALSRQLSESGRVAPTAIAVSCYGPIGSKRTSPTAITDTVSD